MDKLNNGRLLEVGEKLKNEREDRLREIADLKNAKEELWTVLARISSKLQMTWTHPAEVASAVDSVVTKLANFKTRYDDQQEAILKIFRMVKGNGSATPDEVIAAVYRFTSASSNGTASELTQQLESEIAANVELRKDLASAEMRIKQAREAATAFKQEASIAMQTAQQWKNQTSTTETALRRSQASVEPLQQKVRELERQYEQVEKECIRHRNDVGRQANTIQADLQVMQRLNAEIGELHAKLRTKANVISLATPPQAPAPAKANYKALRKAVIKALRDGLEQVKNGGVANKDNSARYNAAFNKGMTAGASIVEVEIYNALPAED